MPEKFQFEELDADTRSYLLLVRDKAGKGVPGVYAAQSNYLPAAAAVGGLVTGAATFFLTIYPNSPTEEPAKEAMLQTAGFLVATWLVVAALRVWLAGASGRYAGHFVYADAETLYEAAGSTVRVTRLLDLREARAVQNFNEGNYQNTNITVTVGRNRTTFQVPAEEAGRRMTAFLNAVGYMRTGGEGETDRTLQTLTPEQMGAIAKEVARTGQFPKSLPDEGNEITHVPHPRKDGRASAGVLGLMTWALIGVGMYFGFRAIDVPFRDEAVFARIQDLPAKDRPWALRMYLAEPAFVAHRPEAQQLLDRAYEDSVNVNVKGEDAQLAAALRELILSLKTREPVASIITAEETPAPNNSGGPSRERVLRQLLADQLGSTIGDELVVFAAPVGEQADQVDTTLKGMIDVRWKFVGQERVEYTVEIRRTPDEAAVASKTFTIDAPPDPTQFAHAVGSKLVADLVGVVRPRPIPPPEGDF